VKKVLYCSEFFYLNSNKKLLMWYKKVKKVGIFWYWLVVKNIKKMKKKKVHEQYCNVLFLDKQARKLF
jgi:predicted nucleotidyltransferase